MQKASETLMSNNINVAPLALAKKRALNVKQEYNFKDKTIHMQH